MGSGPAPRETKRIDAVQTTLDIIEALQDLGGAGVTEIAKHIGVTKGTVHNHLVTLEANDYVIKDTDNTYQLGFRFLDTAHHARNRIEIYDLITQELDKLADETGEMVLFTVEEHGKGVCLYRSFGKHAIETPLYVGYRSHLHRTAVGKAILAQLSTERVNEILDWHGMPGVTENTITDRDELFEELAEIREEGVAYNQEETIQGLIGIGMPILNHDEKITAAISVIGPVSRIDEQTLNKTILEAIRQRSNVIEVNSTSVYNPDL